MGVNSVMGNMEQQSMLAKKAKTMSVSASVCVLGGGGKLEEKADYVFAMCVCLGGGGSWQKDCMCAWENPPLPLVSYSFTQCVSQDERPRWGMERNGMWSSCGQPSHCIGCGQPSPCIGCGQPSGQASDCICCCQPSCCICLGGGVGSSLS